MKKQTPWGYPQTVTELAEGITFHSTSEHGGIELDAARLDYFKKLIPDFEPFCGVAGWFEEDCDWALVPLVFPEAFTPEIISSAARTVRAGLGRYFKAVADSNFFYLESTQAAISHAEAVVEAGKAVAA